MATQDKQTKGQQTSDQEAKQQALADELTQEEATMAVADDQERQGFASMTGGALVPRAEEDDLFEQPDVEVSTGYPTLRLAQGQTAEVNQGSARPGQWVVAGQEATSEAVFMPTRYLLARMRTERNANGGDDIVCRADRQPVKRSSPPLVGVGDPGMECSLCPFSQWTPRDDGSGKNRPPACTLIHIFEGVSLSHDSRVELRLKRTGEKAVRDMLKVIAARGMGNAVFELTQESQKNQANQPYWTPKFRVIPVTPEMVGQAREIARREMEAMGAD